MKNTAACYECAPKVNLNEAQTRRREDDGWFRLRLFNLFFFTETLGTVYSNASHPSMRIFRWIYVIRNTIHGRFIPTTSVVLILGILLLWIQESYRFYVLVLEIWRLILNYWTLLTHILYRFNLFFLKLSDNSHYPPDFNTTLKIIDKKGKFGWGFYPVLSIFLRRILYHYFSDDFRCVQHL